MKENFDDILKRKWEEKSFPMDQHHRIEMIELLNGKKRRRILPIWWMGSLGVVTALAGFFLFQTAPSTQSPAQVKSQTDRPIVSSGADQTTDVSPVESDDDQSVGSSQQIQAPETELSEKSSNQVVTNNESVNPPADANVKSTSSPINKDKQPRTKKSTVPMALHFDQNIPEPGQRGLDAQTQNTDESNILAQDLSPTQLKTEIQTDAPESNQMTIDNIQVPARILVAPISILQPLDISEIQNIGVSGPGSITPNTHYKNSFSIFGEAGAAMILGSTPDFTSGWKIRLGGGLNYTLSSNLGLSFSAGYIMQKGGFDFERISNVNQAGFGTRSMVNSLSPDRLHFIYTRLGAQYRLRRHIFNVHGGVQWLYGAQGTVNVITQDQFAPDATETSEYTWVVTDGLRKLHWTADVAYGYQISPRVALMAGTDMYFSSFTVADDALALEGYYWKGAFSSLHPFITLNYLIYGSR